LNVNIATSALQEYMHDYHLSSLSNRTIGTKQIVLIIEKITAKREVYYILFCIQVLTISSIVTINS